MNTEKINKAKDAVGKSYGFDGWITVERLFEKRKLSLSEFNWMVNESMRLYHKTEIEEGEMVTDEFDKWVVASRYEWMRANAGHFMWFKRSKTGIIPDGCGKTTKELIEEWRKTIPVTVSVQSAKEGGFDLKIALQEYTKFLKQNNYFSVPAKNILLGYVGEYLQTQSLQPKEGGREVVAKQYCICPYPDIEKVKGAGQNGRTYYECQKCGKEESTE